MSSERKSHSDSELFDGVWEKELGISGVASQPKDPVEQVSEDASKEISSVDKVHELEQRDQCAQQVQTGSPVPGVQFKFGGPQAPLRAVRDDGARCGISGFPRCSMQ